MSHLPLQTTLPRAQDSLPSTPLQLAVVLRSSSGVSVDLLRATLFHPLTSVLPVIEECGAMPDLEDREGEVRQAFFYFALRCSCYTDRFAQGSSSWPPINH